MVIRIEGNSKGHPPAQLATAEIHFDEADGYLSGLKLIGFGVWERRSGADHTVTLHVTFPARQYSVNGEQRSFALLRPIVDTAAQERIRDLILEAYAKFDADQHT